MPIIRYTDKLKILPKIPSVTDENVNYQLAALIAYMDVGKLLIFSEDKMIAYRDETLYRMEGKE